jgi:hypothetical protein
MNTKLGKYITVVDNWVTKIAETGFHKLGNIH